MSALAAAIGGIAGFVTVFFWGAGPIVATVVLGMTVIVYLGRGWRMELPWAFIGAGLVVVVILAPALLNSDPAVHYSPDTIPALLVAALVVLASSGWAAVNALSALRGDR